jgi:hypothetical protein
VNKHEIERDTYQCPKLGGEAHLTFVYELEYINESYEPVDRTLTHQSCDGSTTCGVCVALPSGKAGSCDWNSCVYPNLRSRSRR